MWQEKVLEEERYEAHVECLHLAEVALGDAKRFCKENFVCFPCLVKFID